MKPLRPPDLHHLLAAQGWLELGNHAEANEEVELISARNKVHPDVLEVRWRIYSHAGLWAACLDIASTLVLVAPERSDSWIHRSFCLHELKRTQEAYDQLLPVANRFPEVWDVPYNLACYCSQLGRLDEAQKWLKKAILIDDKAVPAASIDDPDLQPLWDSMSVTFWKRE